MTIVSIEKNPGWWGNFTFHLLWGYCILDYPTNMNVSCFRRSATQALFACLWPLARLCQPWWLQSSVCSFHMLLCWITFCAQNYCYNQWRPVENVMQKEVRVRSRFVIRSYLLHCCTVLEGLGCFTCGRYLLLFRHLVGLLGWALNPLQDLYYTRQHNTERSGQTFKPWMVFEPMIPVAEWSRPMPQTTQPP
jgi:hypothetical protein